MSKVLQSWPKLPRRVVMLAFILFVSCIGCHKGPMNAGDHEQLSPDGRVSEYGMTAFVTDIRNEHGELTFVYHLEAGADRSLEIFHPTTGLIIRFYDKNHVPLGSRIIVYLEVDQGWNLSGALKVSGFSSIQR